MQRSPRQTMYLLAAVLLGVAPLGFGLLRVLGPRHDYTGLWMALAASIFAAGVLAASIGRRRSRHAVFIQAVVILVVSTLLAGGIGFALGATAGPGVWMVAFVLALCLAASSVFIAFSREAAR
jgi:Na+/H+-dicarboxylate symporter